MSTRTPPRAALAIAIPWCCLLLLSVPLWGQDDSARAASLASKQKAAAYFKRKCVYKKTAGTIRIAEEGKPRFVILVREGAPLPVRFAGQELKAYLDRMTGCSFEVVGQPTGQPAIILGDGPEAKKAGIDVGSIARDGYGIVAKPDRVVIAGKDDTTDRTKVLTSIQERGPDSYNLISDMAWDFERGTLYGVYRFLEELGCRWFFPGPRGEVVPARPDLVCQAFSLTHEPAFALRVMGRTYWRTISKRHVPIQGLCKKEYADLAWNGRENRLWLSRVRASSEWFAFNHRPPRTRWEQRFGETHPHFFALLPNGERDLKGTSKRRHTGHLCYSQEGVFEETMRDIEAYFGGKTAQSRGIPEQYARSYAQNRGWAPNACYGNTISLLPHDGFRGCRCEACLAKTRKGRAYWATHSDLVWPFVARVARETQRGFPDKILICLAYSSYSEVPANVDLPNNVVVGVCPKTLNKTYNIVGEDSYRDLFGLIERLSGANEMPVLYWFHHLFRLGLRQTTYYGVPMLLPRFFKKFVNDLSQYGRMSFTELDHDSVMFEHLNRYVVLKLLYDPTLDVDALLRDYVTSFYGPAADVVEPMLREIETHSEEIAASGAKPTDIWERRYSAETMKRYRAQADKAVELTRGTPHEDAARLFSKYFIGLMEAGRARYVRRMKDPKKLRVANLPVRRTETPIVVDGNLSEKAWADAVARRLLNNVNGEPTQWPSEIRVVWSPQALHCAFTCHDPRVAKLKEGVLNRDYVEIFLNPQRTSPTFYQILVYTTGEVLDFRCDSRTKKWDAAWQSHAKSAFRAHDDRWVMEVMVPLRHMKAASPKAGDRWGANLCRTIWEPVDPLDKFSSYSPFMRGSFRQPDLFGKITFE